MEKKFIVFPFVVAALTIGSQAKAEVGTRDGGGGVGVRCAGGTLQVLDLHEARRHGIKISRAPHSQEEAIAGLSHLIAAHYWNPAHQVQSQYEKTLETGLIRPLFLGETLKNPRTGAMTKIEFVSNLELSKDIGRYDIAANCHLEQIAYFDDQVNTLRISKTLWGELDWLGKMATFAHEMIYFIERLEGFGGNEERPHVSTSESTRRFVGQLFSDVGIPGKYESVPASGAYWCLSAGNDNTSFFWLFQESSARLKTVFSRAFGRSSPYETSATLAGIQLGQMTGPTEDEFEISAPLEIKGDATAPALTVHLSKKRGNRPQLEVWRLDNSTSLGPAQEFSCWKEK